MGHIFNAKHIKDERELGEGAERNSRNDLTCLKPAFLPGSKEAHCTYPKKKGSERLGHNRGGSMGRVLVVHSGQMCYRSWKVSLVPLGQDCFYGVRGTYPVGQFSCRHRRFALLASRAEGSSSLPVMGVTPPKHGAVSPAAWQAFRESGKKRNWCKRDQAGTYLGFLLWVAPKQQPSCQQIHFGYKQPSKVSISLSLY